MKTNPYASPETAATDFPENPAENQEPIVLSGTLSVADVVHAQRLASRALGVGLMLFFLALVGVLSVLLLMGDSAPRRSPALLSRGMLLIAGITLLLVYIVSYAGRYLAFSWQARQGLGVFAPSHTVVTPDGFATVSEHASSQLKWSLFRGYRISNRVIVLYVQFPHQFLILARDKLEDPMQWPRLVSLVQRSLPRR